MEMNDFVNNINNVGNILPADNLVQKNIVSRNQSSNDTFEKNNDNKILEKKKNLIAVSIVAGIALLGAFLSRKQLSELFSKIFRKNSNTIPNQAQTQIKETQEVLPEQKLQEALPKKQNVNPIFPYPKFGENPTTKEKEDYIKSIAKYLSYSDDTLQLNAIRMVEKYGVDDIDRLQPCLLSENDEIVQSALKIYAKLGDEDCAYKVIMPIRGEETISMTQRVETYIETLKTIQKLAHLENDTPRDREVILEPVRRLLGHQNEEVKRVAQETLDKIDVK